MIEVRKQGVCVLDKNDQLNTLTKMDVLYKSTPTLNVSPFLPFFLLVLL